MTVPVLNPVPAASIYYEEPHHLGCPELEKKSKYSVKREILKLYLVDILHTYKNIIFFHLFLLFSLALVLGESVTCLYTSKSPCAALMIFCHCCSWLLLTFAFLLSLYLPLLGSFLWCHLAVFFFFCHFSNSSLDALTSLSSKVGGNNTFCGHPR